MFSYILIKMPLDLKINIDKYLENNKLKIDINTFQKMINKSNIRVKYHCANKEIK